MITISLRKLLATSIIYKKSLADLVIKSRLIRQRTGNPVYFVKNDKRKGKDHVRELTWNAREVRLSPSPFYTQKVTRKLIQTYRDILWEDEWVNISKLVAVNNRGSPSALII